MRLEWLEDVLAVLETGSFVQAAEQRYLTQPAFSRRIKQIEAYIGVELFDRSKKPVQLKRSVIDQRFKIQELAAGLRDLRNELKRQTLETHNRIVIACQHAITTSVAPDLIRKLSTTGQFNTRLRSANHDECYTLLMTKQVDFIITHQAEHDPNPSPDSIFEQFDLYQERFIPVYASKHLSSLNAETLKGNLSVVAYPSDSYLGQVVNREIFSQIWHATTIHKKAETALTLAALPLALTGVGVAWLPYSIAASALKRSTLTDLSDILPSCELSIVAARLNDPSAKSNNAAWDIITST